MFCPCCKAEYKRGITHCPDCDIDLVSRLPKESQNEACEFHPDEDYEVVSFMNVDNKVQADLIMNMLENNDISCFKKPNGTGGYLDLYSGNNIYGEDIYVHKKDYAEAYDLCQEFLTEDDDAEEQTEEDIEFAEQVEKMHKERKEMNHIAAIMCRIILIVAIGTTIVTCITDWFF